MNIALCLLATRKYKSFVAPILPGIIKNFLPQHQIIVHLFTDELMDVHGSDRVRIEQHLVQPYSFPTISLYRYKIFTEHAYHFAGCDWVFYSDVDMDFVDTISDEILQGDIVGVRHPGFWYNNGWGSGGNNPESLSYIEPEFQKKYFCGGFQAGRTDKYLTVCKLLSEKIADDESRNVLAIYHDETFWNYFLNYAIGILYPDWIINELTPEYCSVPSMEQRERWGIAHLPAKIVALDKNHEEIRS